MVRTRSSGTVTSPSLKQNQPNVESGIRTRMRDPGPDPAWGPGLWVCCRMRKPGPRGGRLPNSAIQKTIIQLLFQFFSGVRNSGWGEGGSQQFRRVGGVCLAGRGSGGGVSTDFKIS